jgi:hypothetical protein
MANELHSNRKLKTLNMKTLGIILIVVGGIMTVFTGFNVITKKKVVDLGAVEINKEEKTPIYWSPITGAVLLAAGVVILLVGKKRA